MHVLKVKSQETHYQVDFYKGRSLLCHQCEKVLFTLQLIWGCVRFFKNFSCFGTQLLNSCLEIYLVQLLLSQFGSEAYTKLFLWTDKMLLTFCPLQIPPAVQSGLSPPTQQQAPARPPGPSVQVPPPFLLQNQYEAVQPHWFYCKEVEYKQLWMPFSVFDSLNLEKIYNSGKHGSCIICI